MYNKKIGFSDVLSRKFIARRLLPLTISATLLFGSLFCSNGKDEDEIEITPVTTTNGGSTGETTTTTNDQKKFPLRIFYKDHQTGDVLIRNDYRTFEYNYVTAETLPCLTWEPLDNTREVKEYLYTFDNATWFSNGQNTSLQVTTPRGKGYGFFYVKAVFTDGTESYTYGLTYNLVEKFFSGLQFNGLYNENFQRFIKTSDGGYLAVGVQQFFSSEPGTTSLNNGLLLNKYDASFNLVWSQRYSGNKGGWDIVNILDPNKERAEEQIIETADSFMVLMTVESNDGIFSGNKGLTDIALLKIDKSSGEVKFSKMFGTTGYDFPWKLMKLPNDEFLVLWTMRNDTNESFCLSKINSAGDIIFEKVLPETTEWYFNAFLTENGLMIFHELKNSSTDHVDVKVKRYDLNANLIQNLTLKDASSLSDAKRLANGNFVLYGTESGKIWLMELDNALNIINEKYYADGPANSSPGNVVELANGNLVITSSVQRNSAGNTWILELDGARNILWEKYLGSSDFNGWVGIPRTMTINGNDIVVFNSIVSKEMLLSRVQNNNVLWSRALSFPYGTYINSITSDNDGNIVLVGEFLGDFGKNALILKFDKDTGEALN